MKTYDQLFKENLNLKKEIKAKNEKIHEIIIKYEKKIRNFHKINLNSAINEIIKINSKFTIKEVATLFDVSTTTVYRAIKQRRENNDS